MRLYIKRADGNKYYYADKERTILHRNNGPAIECANGDKEYYQNGVRHRIDGPALEFADGNKYYYQHGLLHRGDGAAIEIADSVKYYYHNGVGVFPAPCEGKTVTIDGVDYKLTKLNQSQETAPMNDKIKLSSIYDSEKIFWGIVYHVQPDSSEVEMLTEKLFPSKAKAQSWLDRNVRLENWIQPEVVEVTMKYISVKKD